MSGTADPWEPACMPTFQWRESRKTEVERTPGPERIYDKAAADPTWKPRPVGFTAKLVPVTAEPQLPEGQD